MSNPMMPVPVGHCYAIHAGTIRTAISTGKTRQVGGYRQVLLASCFKTRNLWIDANRVFCSRESARFALMAIELDERRASA